MGRKLSRVLSAHLEWCHLAQEIIPLYFPKLYDQSEFPPWTMKPSVWTPRTRNTGYFTSLTSFSKWFSFFSFIFILTKYLKNYSKSYKNHKIENQILLDSTLLDLCSEYII